MIKTKYDVVVIGGGTSGFAAAIGAANSGADTLILEENAFLGGMATGGMVSQLMGFIAGEKEPIKGVVGNLLKRLREKDACSEISTVYLAGRKEADVDAVTYDAETMKHVLDQMTKEAGVNVLFHAKVIDIEMLGMDIQAVKYAIGDKIFRVEAKVFIDASFHGVVAAGAGLALQEDFIPEDMQPASLMFKMANVDNVKFSELSQEMKKSLTQEGIEKGSLFVDNILARPMGETGIYFHNMSRLKANVTDPESWSSSESMGREQVQKISQFLISRVPGFENAVLVTTGSFLGLRDSRRFKGLYTLNKEDIIKGTKFADAVAGCSFPIDIHSDGYDYTFIKPKNDVFYVPFRSMISEVNNLVLTGRIVSADAAAHGCLRVMICCMRLGEAAGRAAAKSVQCEVRVNQIAGEKIGLM